MRGFDGACRHGLEFRYEKRRWPHTSQKLEQQFQVGWCCVDRIHYAQPFQLAVSKRIKRVNLRYISRSTCRIGVLESTWILSQESPEPFHLLDYRRVISSNIRMVQSVPEKGLGVEQGCAIVLGETQQSNRPALHSGSIGGLIAQNMKLMKWSPC
ncbi:hypothetical protein P175DRAFT_0553280 [Aspergillus ochraceoroseus IBT 24754]|uniref:Uncharacterized protein n=1 Tax=Aspergillus ochraceoroseus IBT 24754 TaxID=1392256 RepID=A0A2T5M633_9EURO|nr:uncharacterized protein P175DRAFT_0553280 [Aspergillus ochraceoroseus IBT 24754]PTU23989.1 hypothetical protein P175DRAFT_0553280 [Aspergillus ochraceoroseus IBT 24754]